MATLISISNGIKDGTIQNPHMLPPDLRQRVLDTVLKRGFVNNPNCLALLSSVEFLEDMTSFSTSAGSIYDGEYLERLIRSMAAKLPNGETVGAAITKLDLSVYGCAGFYQHSFRMGISNFPAVSQLIAKCPNVTSLALRGVESDGPLKEEHDSWKSSRHPWFPYVLNQNGACDQVMGNLVELCVSNWKHRTGILGSGRPIIDFKQLSILKLDNCSVDVDQWPEFLRKIPTLECLQMIDATRVGGSQKGLDWVLPFSMPNLKRLEIIGNGGWGRFKCNKAFVDNLMGCPELRQVHLMLDEKSTDEESMGRLADMDIDLKVKCRLAIRGNDNAENAAVIDSSSHFKIVSIFHERLESFELTVEYKWSPLISTALEDVIDTCLNLTSFNICLPETPPRQAERNTNEDMKQINAALVRFFGAQDRPLQLKDLSLEGNFDEAVVSTVFENCLNLLKLRIRKYPALRDQHLIDWVSRHGGKLSHLSILWCDNVTSAGIIPILARSAEGLLGINICGARDGRNWNTALNMHCPNAQAGFYQ